VGALFPSIIGHTTQSFEGYVKRPLLVAVSVTPRRFRLHVEEEESTKMELPWRGRCTRRMRAFQTEAEP